MPTTYSAEIRFDFEEFNDDRAKEEIKCLLHGYDIESIVLFRRKGPGLIDVARFDHRSGNIDQW